MRASAILAGSCCSSAVSARAAVQCCCHSRMILLDTRKPPLPNTGNGGEHTHTMGRRYLAMRLMETTRREPAGPTLRRADLSRAEQQRPKSCGGNHPQQSRTRLRHRGGRRRNRCRRDLGRRRLRGLRRWLRGLRSRRRRCRRGSPRLKRGRGSQRRSCSRSSRWLRRECGRGCEAQRRRGRALGRQANRDQADCHQQPHQGQFLPVHRQHLLPPQKAVPCYISRNRRRAGLAPLPQRRADAGKAQGLPAK